MGSDRKLHVLRNLGRIVTGKTPKTAVESYFNGVTPFVTPTDFDGRRWIGETLRTLTSSGVDAVRSSLVPAESVMVTCIGSDMGKVAMSAVASVTNQQINTLVVSPEHEARYVYYNLLGRRAELRALAAGSAQPILNKSAFGMIEIELPACPEQCAVADVLSALDDRIDLLRQTNTTLEAIAQVLFKSWFVDFDPAHAKAEGREPEAMNPATAALFPSEFEESELGTIPKGWRVDEIGNAVKCLGGATPSTKEDAYWVDGEHHWVTPKDLAGLQALVLTATSRRVTDAGLSRISSGLLPRGTLLMSSRAPIGYLALAGIPTAINQGFIAMPPGGTLPPIYLFFWTRANMDSIKQKANGSTFMEISKSAFRPIKLSVPPPKLVDAFVAVAAPLMDRIEANEHHRVALTELRDTLLPRLISGKLRLPDATKTVEEAVA